MMYTDAVKVNRPEQQGTYWSLLSPCERHYFMKACLRHVSVSFIHLAPLINKNFKNELVKPTP